jgi:hypothetical protein
MTEASGHNDDRKGAGQSQQASAEQLELVKLQSIFMPYAVRRREAIAQRNGRFVHYTSAESALNIIQSKRIWMRSTTCMSDYSEVQHGGRILQGFFADSANKTTFVQALDACAAGLAQEVLHLFDQWWNDLQLQSYIFSISEHDEAEDLHGRLSMWRAFSRSSARVAIVMRLPLTEGSAAPLNLLLSPVSYFTDTQVYGELHSVARNIEANRDFLQKTNRPSVVSVAFHMLVLAALCLKHEGFHEEREWRLIYSPKRNPSSLISSSIELIDGVPQTVYKIPLEGTPSADLVGIDIPHLLDRVIIGPSLYPWAMYEAFVTALMVAGIKDANARVFISGIPIRT